MKSTRLLSRFSLPFFLSSLLLLTSCAVFTPVGNTISSGYQNTVAYFNSYYNASRIFDEAEEEILAVRRRDEGTESGNQPAAAPPAAKQKLNVVLDKCSNILSFYASSALVDDALLLAGKSYYYLGEYVKAERKFRELLSQYPNSSIGLVAKLWLVKSLVSLSKNADAMSEAEAVIETALSEGEEEIAAEAFMISGVLFSREGLREEALQAYGRAIELSSSDDLRAYSQFRLGEELALQGKFIEASGAFRNVELYTDERIQVLRANIRAIQMMRDGGQYATAIDYCNDLLEDYRFAQDEKEIIFERGKTYAESGEIQTAKRDFDVVDTTAARTAIGSKASFELARLYEYRWGDYSSAVAAYARARSFTVPDLTAEARRKEVALSRYLSLRETRSNQDSILAFEHRKFMADTTMNKEEIAASMDSLQNLQKVNAFNIGEVFFGELQQPDSAVFWYRLAMEGSRDTSRLPRMLFVLAELAKSFPERRYGDSEELYRHVVTSYPHTAYAMLARIELGLKVLEAPSDPGEAMYADAESMIDSGDVRGAITTLQKIVDRYPLSTYAPKSAYAVGWLYEYRLGKPDSALHHYKLLLETYSTSSYADAIRMKMPAGSVPAADTLRIPRPSPEALQKKQPDKEAPVDREKKRPQKEIE